MQIGELVGAVADLAEAILPDEDARAEIADREGKLGELVQKERELLGQLAKVRGLIMVHRTVAEALGALLDKVAAPKKGERTRASKREIEERDEKVKAMLSTFSEGVTTKEVATAQDLTQGQARASLKRIGADIDGEYWYAEGSR